MSWETREPCTWLDCSKVLGLGTGSANHGDTVRMAHGGGGGGGGEGLIGKHINRSGDWEVAGYNSTAKVIIRSGGLTQ